MIAQVNESEPSAECTSAFVGAVPGQTLVLGAPFLRHWFTSYRYGQADETAKIGIAKGANSSEP